jgi:molecular chaperone DnaK
VIIFEDAAGRRTIPSVVSFTRDGPVVGAAAKALSVIHPENTVYEAKRFMGRRCVRWVGLRLRSCSGTTCRSL